MTKKIIETILWGIVIIFYIYILSKFVSGLVSMDDEIMFIYGFLIMVFTSLIVVSLIITFAIYSIWKKEKGDKHGKKNSNNDLQ